jgi:1,5-anhydro-D-fructose reductase (1,5-anhydro-D-mannitol-forming)
MVKAAREAGVVFGTNLRNMGGHRAIKRLMEERAIGKVVAARIFHAGELPQSLKTWRLYDKTAGGNVIFDIGVHDADLLRFYFGSNRVKIAAIATTSADGPKEVEDRVMSVWEFPGNVLVQCHDSFVTGAAPRGAEIHAPREAYSGSTSCLRRLAVRLFCEGNPEIATSLRP